MKKKSCKSIRKIIIFFFFLTFIPFKCIVPMVSGQSVVYIDPSYSGGSNDGSSDHPYTSWANIPKFSDNTSYLQKRGTYDTIPEQIAIKLKTGTTFGVYGIGADYAHLHSKHTNNNKGGTFVLEACRNCMVDGFHLTSNYWGPEYNTYGVYILDITSGSSDFISKNILIENCLIEKFTWGIRMMAIGRSLLDSVRVEKCTIQNIFWDGMFIQGWTGGKELHGVDINNCYITKVNAAVEYYENRGEPENVTESNCGGDGIQISQLVDGWRIRNTIIDRRNSGLKFCIIHGDEIGTRTCGGTIENCTIYAPDKSYGGAAFYLSILDTVNMRNNKVYGNSNAAGILLRWSTVLNCSYNTFSGFTGANGYSYTVLNVQSDKNAMAVKNKIQNNTFYNNEYAFNRWQGNDLFDIKNNIFCNVTVPFYDTSGVMKDYNIYYNADSKGTEANSIVDKDPMLNGPSSGDFRLQEDSPCIDAGINLGYSADIAGTILPQGNGMDIGAYEYVQISGVSVTQSLIKFYPNPTHDNFTIETENPISLKILDIKGQIWIDTKVSPGKTIIPVTMNPGLYLIKITDSYHTIQDTKLSVY